MAAYRAGDDDDTAMLRPEFSERGPRGYRPRQWTLWDALRAYSFRNLAIAVTLAVLAGAGGTAAALKQATQYSGKAQLLIDQPRLVANTTDEGPLRKLSLLRLKYVDLVTTPAITGPASAQLGTTEKSVADNVTGLASPQNLLLEIDATDPTRAGADRIANTVARTVITYADDEQAGQGVPQVDRYRFTLVEAASLAAKTQPKLSRAVQAGGALFLIGFALAYALLQMLTAPVRLR
jgi:capsular polysaccharide biosynthesis protein